MKKEVLIENYSNDLKGICTVQKKEYLVPGTIKNEKVLIDIEGNSVKKLEILTPSPHRVPPTCPIFDKCGGCSFQHIEYQEQLKIKTKWIENLYYQAFKRRYKVESTVGMENPYGYRNKNQMVLKKGHKGLIGGMYEEGTHHVLDFNDCKIQDEVINSVQQMVKELLIKYKYQAFDEDKRTGIFRHVLVKRSKSTKEIMVVLVTATDNFPGKNNFVKDLIKKQPEITTVIQNINNRKTSAVLGEKELTLYGPGFIIDYLLGKKFKITSKSFYQINSLQTEKLYQLAIEKAKLSKNEVLLDAYSGVGTIGILAASYVKEVISVEIVKDAVNCAILNAKYNDIKNIRFFANDATEYINHLVEAKKHIDVIVLDPPRGGSTKEFLNAVNKLLPKKIIYISCNPKTQVEDLKHLLNNYDIKYIQGVDMFPFTNHVETVTLLQRKDIDDRLKVRFDLENIPLVKEETKATYQEIKDFIFNKYNVKVSSLNIAQTKTKYGIVERECYNKPKDDDSRQHKCTREKEEMIIDALKYFKML